MVKIAEDSPDYRAIATSLRGMQESVLEKFWGLDRLSLKRKRQDSIYAASESRVGPSITSEVVSTQPRAHVTGEGRLRSPNICVYD
jgi:hypothetical protein